MTASTFSPSPCVRAPDNAAPSLEAANETPTIGHNASELMLSVELRLYNRVYSRFGNGVMVRRVECPAGMTLGELVAQAGIPESEVFIAFINGRDASVGPGALVRERALAESDVVALSGPVPYSWGYGAPVV